MEDRAPALSLSQPSCAFSAPMKNFATIAISLFLLSSLHADQENRKAILPTGETVDFLLYQPKAQKAHTTPPLLLFLHGGGESGDDLEKVKTHGPPKEIENGRDYPMIVVSPLNPDAKGFWDEDRLARFLDQLETEIEFDPHRIYLAGMSRGGYGAYRLAMENPDRFAAMVVLCAAAPTPYAGWLGNLPIWLIHGEKDPVIPVDESIRMERAIQKKGGEVKLSIHPDAQHDVWTRTFSGEAVVDWLLEHKRSD